MEKRPAETSESVDPIHPQQADEAIFTTAPAKKRKLDDVDSDSDGPPPSPRRWYASVPPKKPMMSLRKQVEKVVLKQLSKALEGNNAPARYCCGGRVLTTLSAESNTTKNTTTPVSPPIILRWDDHTDNDTPRRIRLPIATGTSKGNPVAFSVIDKSRLLKACGPGGILPGSQFSTNLDPHYLGILDVIAQTLLPSFESSVLEGRSEHRGVSAQLTHLQVQSGPSNGITMFLPPLPAKDYLGILLICLPNMHQGGQLEVTNNKHSTIFDWSSAKPTDIKWAASIGDCQHKMHPMQKGNQLILVYNLRVTDRVGTVIRNPVLADSTQLPLYDGVRTILEHPGFMKEGGILGFYCRYPYNHTAPSTNENMPYALKGVDLVVHNVFRSLGLEVKIRPLLEQSELDNNDELEYEIQGDIYADDPWSFPEYLPQQTCPCGSTYGCSGGCSPCFPDFPSFKEWKALRPRSDLIGTEFQEVKYCETGEDAKYDREYKEDSLNSTWSFKKYRNIQWLNEPEPREKGGHWELALHNIPYTEFEVYPEKYYSHAVLLVRVPRMAKRNLTVNA